jgi:two-component system sensor histidine kinase MprB
VTLRTRVSVAGAVTVSAALLIAAAVIYPAMRSKLGEQLDASLVHAAAQTPVLVSGVEGKTTSKGAPFQIAPGLLGRAPSALSGVLVQVIPYATHLGAPPGVAPVDGQDVQVAAGAVPPYFHDLRYGATKYRIYTAPLPASSHGLVRVGRPLSEENATLDWLRTLLAGIVLAGGVLAALIGRLLASRVLQPVVSLSKTVDQVTQTHDLSARIQGTTNDEIGRLASAFNAMLETLQRSLHSQRQLVADASHELRTPLASLITNLDLLGDGEGLAAPEAPRLLGGAREQAGALASLVSDLVELARFGETDLHIEDTRLDLLAARALARAAERGPHLRFDQDLHASLVPADADAIERAIDNLLDNAIKWSPDGATITVQVSDGQITVTDHGPGIAAADLPHIFERFYRAPSARSFPGSGLGLAIVREIAQAHHGTVTAECDQDGTRLRIHLPTADTPAGATDPQTHSGAQS